MKLLEHLRAKIKEQQAANYIQNAIDHIEKV
jgi:hypothetical protein